ncbi:MAG TPA: extracellular solute-binding protein [Abditibacteriaceae bacterium]|jgi:iron(III) transport system substrate-binding protein
MKNLFLCALILAICGCTPQRTSQNPTPATRVVLYCSVDDVYARPILAQLEKETGLRIDVIHDTEAAKTAGLANRIRAEATRPRADVFWSSALLQTLLLQREGLLQSYVSPNAATVPAAFKEARGAWTANGVRSRVIVFQKGLPKPPRTYADLLKPRFKNAVGISNPQFGTASDEAAFLTTRWGETKALSWYRALRKNGAKVLPGNSVVAQRVARGELLAGITDSDDYLAQVREGGNIDVAQMEWMAVPGAVAILKGAPHNQNAQKLVDALLAAPTQTLFAKTMPGVWTTAPGASAAWKNAAPADTARWAESWQKVREPLAQIVLAP